MKIYPEFNIYPLFGNPLPMTLTFDVISYQMMEFPLRNALSAANNIHSKACKDGLTHNKALRNKKWIFYEV